MRQLWEGMGMSQFAAYENVTVTGSATALTSGTYGTMDKCLITVEGANVRFRLDGSDPTATVGHLLKKGDVLECDGDQQLQHLRFIRVTGQSATLRCSYGT